MAAFDPEADNYDGWYSTRLGKLVDDIETKASLHLLDPRENMRILDVGCGTGNYSIKLSQLGCSVVGVDISENMLEIAKKKSAKLNLNIRFLHSNSEELPFDDESFDAVISITAIEFFTNPGASVKEMLRVIKEKGSLVIGTINKDSPWGKLYSTTYFKDNTVFRYANFLNKDYLNNIEKDKLIQLRTCLFIPPDTIEENLSIELETNLSKLNEGGFICCLWKK